MVSKILKNVNTQLLLVALVTITACASPAERASMTVISSPTSQNTNGVLHEQVALRTVVGGEPTNPLWTSEVGNAEFRGALEDSLRNAQLLCIGVKLCAYQLDANLLGQAQPAFGFDMEVTSHINYELFDAASERPIFQETISTSHTESWGAAFSGVERLRLASEGSIRSNISEFLSRLRNIERTELDSLAPR